MLKKLATWSLVLALTLSMLVVSGAAAEAVVLPVHGKLTRGDLNSIDGVNSATLKLYYSINDEITPENSQVSKSKEFTYTVYTGIGGNYLTGLDYGTKAAAAAAELTLIELNPPASLNVAPISSLNYADEIAVDNLRTYHIYQFKISDVEFSGRNDSIKKATATISGHLEKIASFTPNIYDELTVELELPADTTLETVTGSSSSKITIGETEISDSSTVIKVFRPEFDKEPADISFSVPAPTSDYIVSVSFEGSKMTADSEGKYTFSMKQSNAFGDRKIKIVYAVNTSSDFNLTVDPNGTASAEIAVNGNSLDLPATIAANTDYTVKVTPAANTFIKNVKFDNTDVNGSFNGRDYSFGGTTASTRNVHTIHVTTDTASVKLKEGVSLTYSPTLTEKDIAEAVFLSVSDSNGNVIANILNYEGLSYKVTGGVDVGTKTVKVTFNKAPYNTCSDDVSVTIRKSSDATVDVKHGVKDYNNGSKVFDAGEVIRLNPAGIEHFTIVAGVDVYGTPSLKVNIPKFSFDVPFLGSIDLGVIDFASIPDSVDSFFQSTFGVSLKALGTETGVTVNLNAFKTIISKIVEIAGLKPDVDDQTLALINSIVNSIEGLDEVNVTLFMTNDDNVLPRQPGAYLTGVVTSDPNYTTAYDASYLIIKPKETGAELRWNYNDSNGIITQQALANGIDLGASAFVNNALSSTLTPEVKTFIIGVDASGKPVINPSTLSANGVYTQIAYLPIGSRTNPVIAIPIARALIIAPNHVNVQVVDRRVAWDGQPKDVDVIAPQDGTLRKLFVGMDTQGNPYRSSTPPTNAGVYTVTATYVKGQEAFGFDVGTLTIYTSGNGFEMDDFTVEEDGNEHFVIVRNTIPALPYIAVVINDAEDTTNVILPESWNVTGGSLNASTTLDDLINFLRNLEGVQGVQEALDALNQLKAQLQNANLSKLTVNGPKPSKAGVYKVYGLAYGPNNGVVPAAAVLTINPKGQPNPNPTDPTDPTVPSLPPANLPQTGDNAMPMLWAALLAVSGALLLVLRKKTANR